MYMSKTPATIITLTFASLVSGYTLSNVTYASNNTAIQLLPTCVAATLQDCPGGWWNVYDPRFYDGIARMSGDPRINTNYEPDYIAFTFQGSAFYVYQWVNSSVADMKPSLDKKDLPVISTYSEHPELTGELQLMMTWGVSGLDPTSQHTIGIEQVPTTSTRGDTYMILDHIEVTQTFLDASDIPQKKVSAKTIAGAVVGAVLGLVGLILGCILLRRWNLKRAAAGEKAPQRYEWQGSFVAPATIKLDPSSEIEASERIAREGREEEEREKMKMATLTEEV